MPNSHEENLKYNGASTNEPRLYRHIQRYSKIVHDQRKSTMNREKRKIVAYLTERIEKEGFIHGTKC